MFTADQLVAHAVGDYILQSQWMADNKRKDSFAAGIHCALYTLPFALITHNEPVLWLIFGSHFLIDRFGLARYIVWLKNGPWDLSGYPFVGAIPPLKPLTPTGYPDRVPPWLSNWLTIIADNILHVLCNGLAIWWLA